MVPDVGCHRIQLVFENEASVILGLDGGMKFVCLRFDHVVYVRMAIAVKDEMGQKSQKIGPASFPVGALVGGLYRLFKKLKPWSIVDRIRLINYFIALVRPVKKIDIRSMTTDKIKIRIFFYYLLNIWIFQICENFSGEVVVGV